MWIGSLACADACGLLSFHIPYGHVHTMLVAWPCPDHECVCVCVCVCLLVMYRLYQQLDRLMLLAEGHIAYYGNASLVVSWFSHLGFAMPYGVNVADFLLDLAQGEVDGGDFSLLAQPLSPSAAQLEQQQQEEAAAVPGQQLDQQKQWQQRVSIELQQHLKQQHSALAAVPLSGMAAIQAIYSSYETFKLKHKEGFSNEAEQLPDVVLALEPPLSRRQKAAAAAATAAGKDPHTAVVAADAAAAAALKRHGSTTGGSFVTRSMSRAGSFLGLASFSGGAAAADDSDDEEQQGGHSISRIWSRSASTSAGGAVLLGPAGAAGGAGGGPGGGLVASTVRRLGVADRGGASYMMQLQVLLHRSIKVGRGNWSGRGRDKGSKFAVEALAQLQDTGAKCIPLAQCIFSQMAWGLTWLNAVLVQYGCCWWIRGGWG